MSLIEKATKRLEELKRAGVEIADGLESSAAGPTTHGFEPLSDPSRIAVLLPEDRKIAQVGTVPQASSGVPSAAPSPVARSPRVAIDLARLAAKGYLTPGGPQSPVAREFALIKRPLIANAQGKSGPRVKNANLIMITSALDGEGKTSSAINLAMSIAMELDSTVLLVDADVANPSVLDALEVPQSRGLLDVLTVPGLDLADVLLRTDVDKLLILPAGTWHERATELLASDAMNRLVDEIAIRYPDRIIVFDSPPLLLTTESPVLASHMGQIVLVVEAERTTVSVLKRALATVENCPIVMTVLNKASTSEIGAYGYGYGYGAVKRAAKGGE